MGSDGYGNPTVNTVAAQAEYVRSAELRSDTWVVAGCGSEQPFVRAGRWYLRVYNFAFGEHGWLDLAEDIVYDDGWNRVWGD